MLCIIKDEKFIIKNIILSPEESKDIAELLAQKRGIEDYESMSNDELYDALRASENENYIRIGKIREEIKKLQHRFSRQELKEIKKDLYEMENKRIVLHQKRLENILIN